MPRCNNQWNIPLRKWNVIQNEEQQKYRRQFPNSVSFLAWGTILYPWYNTVQQPAVRRLTIAQSLPPPHYHGGRVLNDVDNNLEAKEPKTCCHLTCKHFHENNTARLLFIFRIPSSFPSHHGEVVDGFLPSVREVINFSVLISDVHNWHGSI